MKKQKVQMIIVLCILVLGVGGYMAAKNMPKEDETTVVSENHTVTNVAQDDVVEMTYLYEGSIIELVKENDVWKSKEDKSLTLNQTQIETMLGYVCSISTDTVIPDPESLAEYGLTNPTNTICLTLSDGSIVQVLIGDYLDITGENYILLAGDAQVYTVSSYIATSFEKSLDDLIEVVEEEDEELSATEETIAAEE